jgi:hypothetical protein
MKFRFSKLFSTWGILLVVAFAFVSCEKDPTIGNIKVVDLATGAAMPNATVKLFIPSPPAVAGAGFTTTSDGFITEKILTTDNAGNCSVQLKLEAALSIEAAAGAKTGTGVIAFVKYKSTSVTVKVN